jgi:hypothetical protein
LKKLTSFNNLPPYQVGKAHGYKENLPASARLILPTFYHLVCLDNLLAGDKSANLTL